jgi:hypothetical protein
LLSATPDGLKLIAILFSFSAGPRSAIRPWLGFLRSIRSRPRSGVAASQCEQLLEQHAGVIMPALQNVVVSEPKTAGEKCPFIAGQPVDRISGGIAGDETVFQQAFLGVAKSAMRGTRGALIFERPRDHAISRGNSALSCIANKGEWYQFRIAVLTVDAVA